MDLQLVVERLYLADEKWRKTRNTSSAEEEEE